MVAHHDRLGSIMVIYLALRVLFRVSYRYPPNMGEFCEISVVRDKEANLRRHGRIRLMKVIRVGRKGE